MMKLQQKRTATQVIKAHAHNVHLAVFTNGEKYCFLCQKMRKKRKRKITVAIPKEFGI